MTGEKIGVLGGGISGLSFASMVDGSEVIEKEGQCGGLARTLQAEGFKFDCGSHIIFSKNEKALHFLIDALGPNVICHRRKAAVFYKGTQVKYPFENGLSALPKEEAYECAADYADAYVAAQHGQAKPANFKEWMYSRFGKGICDRYLYPYNRKIWDFEPERMDTFWVEGRVPQPSIRDVLKAAMGLESEGYTHQLNFFYPAKGGFQAIADSLVEKIGAGRIAHDEVKSVRKEGDCWVVGGKEERTYRKIVSTIHIQDFLKNYRGAPRAVLDAAAGLKWNSAYLVMAGFKEKCVPDLHWAYIPDADILPNRVSFPSNFSPDMAPEGKSSMLAEVTFDPSGGKAGMGMEEIAQETISGLSRLGIIDSKKVEFTRVARLKYAYVVYDEDYLRNISIVQGFAAQEGVALLGRFSEFKYYNSDACVNSAMEKAAALA